jgi:phenylpropionate dioxygenase-like ring-hydroxylating dioxygenase large terminal subunit
MVTPDENEKLTRVEGDTPMSRLMRENYWLPFSISAHLVPGEAPMPVRLLGENFIAFRADDGRIGFFDELCPHRRASLALGRIEGNGVRCIYHGWKIDVSGCIAEAPTQVVRTEQFAANVRVAHFPVHEAGGLAWVWLGGTEAPAFPELPFAGFDTDHSWMTVSRVPCNWLQGLEGTIDSVHVGFLHQTWHRETARLPDRSNLAIALEYHPSYETQSTPYGMRAAALRRTPDGRTYVRITEHLMPLVTVVPIGSTRPGNGAVFAISPVDDVNHLVFFGAFSDAPLERSEDMPGFVAPGFSPDPHDFGGLRGDRSNRWGQDRELMKAGHFTGFGRNLLEEDAAIQTSMGPILDRTKEHLSSSDVAVSHARRMLLDGLSAAEKGERPPGSALGTDPVRLPNALEGVTEEGSRWEDIPRHQLATSTRD